MLWGARTEHREQQLERRLVLSGGNDRLERLGEFGVPVVHFLPAPCKSAAGIIYIHR